MNNDYIRREDAIDALDRIFDNVPMELTTEILRLRRELRGLSPVDAVSVVRCKDCTFYVVNGCEDYCRKNQHFWDTEKDFCSCGERREG